jgi:hypothetical protein
VDHAYVTLKDGGGTTVAGAGTVKFASNAIAFVKDDNGDWSVENGTAMDKFNGSSSATVKNVGIEKNDNGYNYVTFAVIDASSGYNASSDTQYGFVVSDVSYSNDANGDTYGSVQVWNGSETVTLTGEKGEFDSASTIAKQHVISYEIGSDSYVNNLVDLTNSGGTIAAVTAFDGEDITLRQTDATPGTVVTSKVDADDTTVLFVDYKNKAGEIHSISDLVNADKADSTATVGASYGIASDGTDKYHVNVLYVDNSGTLDLIVVDVNNDYGAHR